MILEGFLTFVSHLFGSTYLLIFILNCDFFFSLFLHQGVCSPCFQTLLIVLLINILHFIFICSSDFTDFQFCIGYPFKIVSCYFILGI